MTARLMLLDAASLYFRAFFGVPREMTAPDGTPVNAVRGFLDMIAVLVEDHRPTELVACWDEDWRPQWRVELLPSYKTHRLADPSQSGAGAAEEVEDDLSVQVPIIVDVLAALGIARVGAPGCEADDVIGTLASTAPADTSVDIVTGDRDLFQLVDDARRVRVLYVGRGVRNREVVDQAALQARYAVADGDGYADLAVMRGDTSDGIPGVPGIGEKTAAKLLGTFGSLTAIVAAAKTSAPGLTPRQRGLFEAVADYLAVAPAVVRVHRDAALPEHEPRLPAGPADPDALRDLVRRWGLESSVERVLTALGHATS